MKTSVDGLDLVDLNHPQKESMLVEMMPKIFALMYNLDKY